MNRNKLRGRSWKIQKRKEGDQDRVEKKGKQKKEETKIFLKQEEEGE